MPWTNIKSEDKRTYDYQLNNQSQRVISYIDSIHETLEQSMALDSKIFLMGQGINDKVGMFGMTNGLSQEFGKERVFDTPLAENGLTGVAVGTAMSGMHPIYFHNRPDFLMLAMDQIVNHASKFCYMSAGQFNVPLIIWAVTGKGWGSAAQHSQALQALFMHIPGLKIIMPTTPYDVKGLLVSAISDKNPVLVLDHRRLHNQDGYVPSELYKIPFGKGVIRRKGNDITLVGISEMLIECLDAAELLEKDGIDAEVIDLRTIKPFDLDIIVHSVKKTHRLIIADTGWKCSGVAAEIATSVYERAFADLVCPIERIVLPDLPTPAAYTLEECFYKTAKDIYCVTKKILRN